jgi:tRNA dimethylallyltransferase
LARQCWFLTGPTASGKTGVGVELALRLGAEIVSMDSMALYRGMDIGTAKPSAADRARVVHHLLDVYEPDEECSLAEYLAAAEQCVEGLRQRGRAALFVGGTPLYLKGLLRGIFEGPPADWPLRRQLADEARQNGPAALHGRLAAVDPAAAARLHPNDARRVIRALEVYQATGQPISQWQRQFETGLPAAECRVFVLDWPRAELHARMDQRVDAMFAAGLVEEVRRLTAGPPLGRTATPGRHAGPALQEGTVLSRTAAQAVGYREVVEHLQGRYDLAETVRLVKLHTRQLAKRQCTWFRSLSECRFIAMQTGESDAAVAERIASVGASSCPPCVDGPS